MERIIEAWFSKGCSETDLTMRFFCFFAAFNMLYDPNSREGLSNCKKIRALVEHFSEYCFANNSPLELGSAFEEDVQVMSLSRGEVTLEEPKTPVLNARKKMKEYETNGDLQKYAIENNVRILLNVYQVRCNLFHGGKRPPEESKNSRMRVTEAANVLYMFLKKIKCALFDDANRGYFVKYNEYYGLGWNIARGAICEPIGNIINTRL